MPGTTNKQHFVFEVYRNDIVRDEVIKAATREEAERILAESHPRCSYRFLRTQAGNRFYQMNNNTTLRALIIFATIFLLTALLLFICHQHNSRYLLFAGLGCLLTAVIYQWYLDNRP